MKRLLGLLFLFGSSICYAQDYAAVYANQRVHYFEDTATAYTGGFQGFNTTTIGLKTDSFQLNSNDTLIFSYDAQHDSSLYYSCVPAGTALQGNIVLKKSEGTVFLNSNGDSIRFNHHLSINSSWKVMDLQNKEQIIAIVYLKDTTSINNTLDSVAYLSLYQADSNNNRLNVGFADTIRLSKNHGLLDFKIWKDFPYANQNLDFFRADIEVPNRGEVFDYDIGDEFHYIESYGSSGPPYHLNVFILNKWFSLNSDTVYYERRLVGESLTVDFSTNPPTVTYNRGQSIDTIFYTDLDLKMIDAVVGELHLGWYKASSFGSLLLIYPKNQVARRRMITVDYYLNYDSTNNCYLSNSTGETFSFGEGLGETWHYTYSNGSTVFTENSLIYYSKGNETFGSPYNIPIGIDDHRKPVDQVKIYPNPAKDHIQIEGIEKKSIVRIYDLAGRLKLELNVSPNASIDINQLEAGIYLLQIENGENLLYRKLVVD